MLLLPLLHRRNLLPGLLLAGLIGFSTAAEANTACRVQRSFTVDQRTFHALGSDVYLVKSKLSADADGAHNAYHLTLPRASRSQRGPLDTLCNGLKIKKLHTDIRVNGQRFRRGQAFNGYITKRGCQRRNIGQAACRQLSRAMCRRLITEVRRIAANDWDQSNTHILGFFGIASTRHQLSTSRRVFNRPCIQRSGDPYPSYFVSQTSHHPELARLHPGTCNPKRYVDASAIPYLVAPIPDTLARKVGLSASKKLLGTVFYAYHPTTGKATFGVFGDRGSKFGEGSLALGWHLKNTPAHARISDHSAALGTPVHLVLFPKVRAGDPGNLQAIKTAGEAALRARSLTTEQLRSCF